MSVLTKLRRKQARAAGPMICGAPHPALDERTSARGEPMTPVVCTARAHIEFDQATRREVRRDHRGDHRARIAKGVLLRWKNDQ